MGQAICIGEPCFCWVTYFWYKGKKLEKPIIRCCAIKCHLDNKPTDEVNLQFREWYPIRYKKPIEKLNT